MKGSGLKQEQTLSFPFSLSLSLSLSLPVSLFLSFARVEGKLVTLSVPPSPQSKARRTCVYGFIVVTGRQDEAKSAPESTTNHWAYTPPPRTCVENASHSAGAVSRFKAKHWVTGLQTTRPSADHVQDSRGETQITAQHRIPEQSEIGCIGNKFGGTPFPVQRAPPRATNKSTPNLKYAGIQEWALHRTWS